MKDSISPVKTKPTPGVPICIDGNDENQEPANYAADVGEGDDKELGTSKTPTPMSKFNKKSTSQELETEVLNKSLALLESATNRKGQAEDAEEIFGRHVAESLKSITEQRSREVAKLKIQQLLFEAQFGGVQHGFNEQPNPCSAQSHAPQHIIRLNLLFLSLTVQIEFKCIILNHSKDKFFNLYGFLKTYLF